jgi:hypothetical protein
MIYIFEQYIHNNRGTERKYALCAYYVHVDTCKIKSSREFTGNLCSKYSVKVNNYLEGARCDSIRNCQLRCFNTLTLSNPAQNEKRRALYV